MKRLLISYLLLLSGCAAGLDSVTYRPVKQEDGGMTIGIGSVTIKTAQQAQPVADDAPARALAAPQQDALTLLFAQAAASGVPVTIQIGASPTPDAILSRGLETPLPVDIVSLPMTIEPTPALNEEGHALITPTPAPVKPKPPRAKVVKTPRPTPTPTPEVLLMSAPDACLQVWQPYHERLTTLLRKKGFDDFTTCDSRLFEGAFVIPILFEMERIAIIDEAQASEAYALEQKGFRVLKVNADVVKFEVGGKTNTIVSWLSCFFTK